MGKIFVNQDVLKIELKYDILPGAVEKAWIKFCNPDWEIGFLPAPAVHNETGQSYYYIFEQGETLERYGSAGEWRFWLYLELVDGRMIPGESVGVTVHREGQ